MVDPVVRNFRFLSGVGHGPAVESWVALKHLQLTLEARRITLEARRITLEVPARRSRPAGAAI